MKPQDLQTLAAAALMPAGFRHHDSAEPAQPAAVTAAAALAAKVDELGQLYAAIAKLNTLLDSLPITTGAHKMKRYTADTLPHDAAYIGSTEGPDRISTQVQNLINDTIAPAYTQDADGTRHFYELCPQDFQPHAYSNETSFL